MSNNPRGRDFVQQAPHMTVRARLPAVPVVRTGDALLDEALRVIKEHLDVRTNSTGNPFERWVTERELHDVGLKGARVRSSVPDDTAAIMVWTDRGRFELLTPLAVATLLANAELPEIAAPPATAQQIADLHVRINALAVGVTPAQLHGELATLAATLPIELRAQFTNELNLLRGRIAALDVASGVAMAVAAAGAASPVLSTRIHLGLTPSKSFVVNFDAVGVAEGATIRMQPDPSTGGDELEMDMLTVAAECRRAGVITAYITATPGPVCGNRSFFYQVG